MKIPTRVIAVFTVSYVVLTAFVNLHFWEAGAIAAALALAIQCLARVLHRATHSGSDI